MKNILLYFILCISVLHSRAQSIAPSSIEDSVIGWMKVYNFKGAKEPVKVENKLYSANQLSICDSFANWIQASYIPKGGLGDVKRTVTGKLGAYNKNTAALPQSYGAEASTYVFLKYNSNRKMVPENSLSLSWTIMANGVPGWEARDISNPAEYYFTMPSFETAFDGEATAKQYDLSKVPPIKPYISFWIKNIEAGNGTNYVLLCKDNRSPFIKLTKGEFLQLLEKAIPRIYQEEKKKLYEKEQGNQKSIAVFMKVLDDSKEKRVDNLKKLKGKYKDRLNEIALTSAQPSIYDLDNGRDVFSNGYMSDQESTSGRVPVYKVDSAMAARCKTDNPQWILISWWWTPNNRVEKHMHESILNNFNFDYVYNFFFDAEKVKGQPYKPVRSPYAKESVVVTNASNAATANAKDKNIHFFEDFSTTVVGKKPNGWHTSLGSDGSTSVIANPAGLDGNWALIRDYTLKATQLKKPLPQNFTLTYELVAAQNFTWGAKGLTFELSKETSPGNAESFLKLRLRPGYDGRDGETVIETKFPSPPGYSNGTKWLTAPGFSNNKKNNHIIVTIKKTEETLQVFIDKIKIAEYEKAIPAAHLFNAMSIYSVNAGENDKFYISNIKVTKD